MSAPDLEFARQWLRKAGNDLFTARCVLEHPDGPADTPCFHAQQAAEKSLKAVLTACGVRFGRGHDLIPLLDAAASRACGLAEYRAACAQLTAYAVGARYPEDMQEFTREEATEALAWAAAIHAAAQRFLEGPASELTSAADAGAEEE